jgi:hypothetical protein
MIDRCLADLQPPVIKVTRFEFSPQKNIEPYTPIFVFSDWHVGQRVELLRATYNRDIFRKRIDSLKREIAEYLKLYSRPMDRAIIAVTGDIIDGPMGNMRAGHQAEQDVLYDKQVKLASTVLAEMVCSVATSVGVPVDVHCIPGNHGRGTASAKEDTQRVPEMCMYHLAEAYSGDLATWTISDQIIHEFRVYDTQVLMAHGERIPRDIDKVIYAMMDKTCSNHLLINGHFHHDLTKDSHKGMGVQSGSIVGDTSFGLHQLGVGARPSQRVIEVRRRGPQLPGMFLV